MADNNLYAVDRMDTSVTTSPINPATINKSAIPLFVPVPNQSPISSTPAPVVIKGMKINWAMGPIRKAVSVLQWALLPLVGLLFSNLPALDAQTRLMTGRYLEYRVTEKA